MNYHYQEVPNHIHPRQKQNHSGNALAMQLSSKLIIAFAVAWEYYRTNCPSLVACVGSALLAVLSSQCLVLQMVEVDSLLYVVY